MIATLAGLPAETTNSFAGSVRDVFAAPQSGLRQAREWLRSLTGSRLELTKEIQRLQIEIIRLRNEIRQYKSIEEENRELRDLLKLNSSSNYRLLTARQVARDVNGWWQMSRIDKGSKHGVQADLPIISPEGLVGQTVGVSSETSDVLFLTNPKVRIAARLTRSEVFGIVRGQGVSWQGDAKCRMDFIMNTAEVNRADEVITSGLGGVYPAGLVIGYVENVQTDPSGLFQYAEIIPAADFRALDLVFIVLPKTAAQPVNK